MTLPREPGRSEPGTRLAAQLRFVVARMVDDLRRPSIARRAASRRPASMWRTPRAAARHAAHEEALFAAHVEQALQIVRQLPTPYAVPAGQIGRVGSASRGARPRVLARH